MVKRSVTEDWRKPSLCRGCAERRGWIGGLSQGFGRAGCILRGKGLQKSTLSDNTVNKQIGWFLIKK